MNTSTTIEPEEQREYKIGVIIVCIFIILICFVSYACYAIDCFGSIDRRRLIEEQWEEEEPDNVIL
jgi:hypothetical protein